MSITAQPTNSSVAFAIKRIGVVGLGHLGRAFAVNLVADGRQVSVYDRDLKRAEVTGARAVEGPVVIATAEASGLPLHHSPSNATRVGDC
jgi:phosphoglycerate dehydrogenase-like enzyme